MPRNEKTSTKIASLAGKQLRSKSSTKAQKRVAASALSQTPDKKRRGKYYSERFIGDTGVTFPSYEANSDGNKVSPIKRSH
jgi:hypothetical protein